MVMELLAEKLHYILIICYVSIYQQKHLNFVLT